MFRSRDSDVEELSAILSLKKIKGLGLVKFKAIFNSLLSITKIFELTDSEMASRFKFEKEIVKGIREAQEADRYRIR